MDGARAEGRYGKSSRMLIESKTLIMTSDTISIQAGMISVQYGTGGLQLDIRTNTGFQAHVPALKSALQSRLN